MIHDRAQGAQPIFINPPMPPGWATTDTVLATIEERPMDDGWSMYILGGAMCLSPSAHRMPNAMVLGLLLWRMVANLTRVCPMCRERVQADQATKPGVIASGGIAHAGWCPVHDEGTAWARKNDHHPIPALPQSRRSWIVLTPERRPSDQHRPGEEAPNP